MMLAFNIAEFSVPGIKKKKGYGGIEGLGVGVPCVQRVVSEDGGTS